MNDTVVLDLYELDALAWAEHQASLLQRIAAGETLNAAVDWWNVIAEVQDVGLSELRACKTLLRQAMVHLIKLHVRPDDPSAAHWRGEVVGFLADARQAFSPSMRRRIDLPTLYEDACDRVKVEGVGPALAGCPFDLDELLAGRSTDLMALVAKLGTGVP